VSDEADVLSLLGRYCHAADGEDIDALLDCYVPGGVFLYYRRGGDAPLLDRRGHDQLAQWFAGHRAATPIGSQTHVTVNPSITIEGDRGGARSTYLSVRKLEGGGIAITATGTYDDQLARGADGRWRLAERICRESMSGA
jgi:hypothetical protein